MKMLTALLGLVIAASSVHAQSAPPAPQQPPEVVALQSRLGQELQVSLQCSTNFVAASRRIAELEAELKALKSAPDKGKK